MQLEKKKELFQMVTSTTHTEKKNRKIKHVAWIAIVKKKEKSKY